MTDKPFVYPYCSYVETISRAVRLYLCVNGSTTVPPSSKLHVLPNGDFVGVPPKAWMWKKKINCDLTWHVHGVVEEGAFNAPMLYIPSVTTS